MEFHLYSAVHESSKKLRFDLLLHPSYLPSAYYSMAGTNETIWCGQISPINGKCINLPPLITRTIYRCGNLFASKSYWKSRKGALQK